MAHEPGGIEPTKENSCNALGTLAHEVYMVNDPTLSAKEWRNSNKKQMTNPINDINLCVLTGQSFISPSFFPPEL